MAEAGDLRGDDCTQAVITTRGKPTANVLDRPRTASDLHMMIQHDGKERDTDQWAGILAKVRAFYILSFNNPPWHRVCVHWSTIVRTELSCRSPLSTFQMLVM